MSPTVMPAPSLPAPVTQQAIQGGTVGQKPKNKTTTPTVLGADATANPVAGLSAPTGKTFLGQ